MEELRNDMLIEQRILRIEERLDRLEFDTESRAGVYHPGWAFGLGMAALLFGFLGLGLPQHYYQILFAGLLLLLLYHRDFLLPVRGYWRWPQMVLNFLLFLLLFKLLIGGGITHPFEWLKVPVISKGSSAGDTAWYEKLVPNLSLEWKALPVISEWALDLTKIQTLLLIAILAGALFRFEPFTSLTAIVLILVSLPRYLQFNWDWVVLFLIIGSISVYLQSRMKSRPQKHE